MKGGEGGGGTGGIFEYVKARFASSTSTSQGVRGPTDLRVQGWPSFLASSASTVRMEPVLKPRCSSRTECRQTRSKAALSMVLPGCSGCTPAYPAHQPSADELWDFTNETPHKLGNNAKKCCPVPVLDSCTMPSCNSHPCLSFSDCGKPLGQLDEHLTLRFSSTFDIRCASTFDIRCASTW